MTTPNNISLDEKGKQYLKKRIHWNIVAAIATFVIASIILFIILRDKHKDKDTTANPDTAKILRGIADTMIAEGKKKDFLLSKMADSSKLRDNNLSLQLNKIGIDLKTEKKTRDEKIDRITNYQSDDIISEFSNIERQYKAAQ